MLAPEDRRRESADLIDKVRSGGTLKVETVRRRKDGSLFDVALTLAPFRNARGEVFGFAGNARDVTERRAAEGALRESEAYIRLLLNSAAEGFYGLDRDGVTTLCNTAFLTMLGFEREEDVIGRALHDVIHHSQPGGTDLSTAIAASCTPPHRRVGARGG
jgi:PAS domain-containing protein